LTKRGMPPRSAVSVMPSAVKPNAIARATSASGDTVPSPKEKPVWARSSTKSGIGNRE
jgi:hypothetical protein